MNDFMQPQSNTPLSASTNVAQDNTVNTNVPQNTTATNIPAFQVDLSGLTNKAVSNEPTIIGSSPETGPIILDNRVEPVREIDKKIEFGNEAVQSIEKNIEELKVEKLETVTETSSGGQKNTIPVQSQKDDKPLEKNEKTLDNPDKREDIKYSGYPIDGALLKDPEKVKREKGKGDPSEGLNAVLILLDRLFRIRDKSK